jgi:hypothetical protein
MALMNQYILQFQDVFENRFKTYLETEYFVNYDDPFPSIKVENNGVRVVRRLTRVQQKPHNSIPTHENRLKACE